MFAYSILFSLSLTTFAVMITSLFHVFHLGETGLMVYFILLLERRIHFAVTIE
jgi:hypothetical protein